MSLQALVDTARDKTNFLTLAAYLDFCRHWLEFTDTGLQATIVLQNENHVQRKSTRRENEYGINSTFLSGHFKAFTVKLNPLDGVYYCDIRPNMQSDTLLKAHIQTIDHFFCSDLWALLGTEGTPLAEVEIFAEEDL